MAAEAITKEKTFAYRVLRYAPNLVRDEWVNIGVLVFDPETGERRLRMIEEPGEYARVRRLHPRADEGLLRALRDDLENRFATATQFFGGNGKSESQASADWLRLLAKWDETLSNALQLAPQKGVHAGDLDAETERLYADHVAPERGAARVGAPGSRGAIRSYCAEVFKQARVWERMQKGVRAEEFTFAGDPMRIDYGYRRNGTRGICAHPERFACTGRCEVTGVHRGAHSRQGGGERVHGGDRCGPDGGKRTAPVRAGGTARRGRCSGASRGVGGVDGADAAVASVDSGRWSLAAWQNLQVLYSGEN
jgi:Protein of unknown function (DUF3037)